MGRSDETAGPRLKLFEAWMDTTRWLFERTARFPKRLRQSLTQRIEETTLEVLEGITTAAFRADKTATLAAVDDGLNRLRVLVRLAHELEVLSHGQYEESARRLRDAGRMVGGWWRHAESRRDADG